MNDQTSKDNTSGESEAFNGPVQGTRAREWYYALKNTRCGPVSEESLVGRIKSKELTATTPIWTKGMPKWVLIKNTYFSVYLPQSASDQGDTLADQRGAQPQPAAHITDNPAAPPAGEPEISTEWFYALDGNRRGPVPERNLIEKIKSGELGRNSKIWKKGLPKWILLENTPFREFLPEAGPPPLPKEPAANLWNTGTFESPKPPTPPRKILAIIGVVACLMVLFPPVHTYHERVVVDDRGIYWQRLNPGGDPMLRLIDPGGYRDERFIFILSLGENDKILFPQLVFQEVALTIAGLVVVAWKGKRDINQRPGQEKADSSDTQNQTVI